MQLSNFSQDITKVEWDGHIDYLNNLPSVVPTKEETYLSLKNHISKNIRGAHFGVLLSGGVDSSIIAKICKDLGRPFRCFCVGIEGSKDIFHANRISDFFGFDLVAKEYTIQEVEVLLNKVIDQAYKSGLVLPDTRTTPYINTIPPEAEIKSPGDQNIEKKIRAYVRWNAAAMVVKANKKSPELGGHIGTFASAATLYDVGMNHF